MKKVFLKDCKNNLIVLDIMISIVLLEENIKIPISIEKINQARKIFMDTLNEEFDNYPEFILEVANRWNENDIEIDIDRVRKSIVKMGINTLYEMQKISPNFAQMEEKLNKIFDNSFMYENVYDYMEQNLKKILVSEMFKRELNAINFICFQPSSFKIKISEERLEKIFDGETIKNKSSFFRQQLYLWSSYNKISTFLKFEEVDNDIFITFALPDANYI